MKISSLLVQSLIFSALLTMAVGCRSKLEVWDANEKTVNGVPVKIGEVYVKQGFHSEHSKGKPCDKAEFVDTVVLPTGATYYINVDPADFAKTGLVIKTHESGVLAEVTLNTDPASEAISSTTEALTSLLPFLGLLPSERSSSAEAQAEAAPSDETQNPACDAGETDVKFFTLKKWIEDQ